MLNLLHMMAALTFILLLGMCFGMDRKLQIYTLLMMVRLPISQSVIYTLSLYSYYGRDITSITLGTTVLGCTQPYNA